MQIVAYTFNGENHCIKCTIKFVESKSKEVSKMLDAGYTLDDVVDMVGGDDNQDLLPRYDDDEIEKEWCGDCNGNIQQLLLVK